VAHAAGSVTQKTYSTEAQRFQPEQAKLFISHEDRSSHRHPYFSCPSAGEAQLFVHSIVSIMLSSQLPSSHGSSTASTRHPQRRPSAEKAGGVPRTSSASSLHRSGSSKSNSSTGMLKNLKHHVHHVHHPHVARTSASRHHRTASFGHRVPSYGKGLNKLTALTTVHTEDRPKEYLSVHSVRDRAGGTGMQRSFSEGSGIFHYGDCV
jgi:hypothetical protein